MHLEQISSIEVYDTWTSAHSMNHYMKSSKWAQLCTLHGDIPIFLGLYDQKTLIGTCLVLIRKKYGVRYFYLGWGPCLSLEEQQFKAFYHGLIQLAEKKQIAFIKCGLNLTKDHLQIINWMEELGFHHKGFGYGYDGSWLNRYTLTLDLNSDIDAIYQGFSVKRKAALKQQKLYCIEVKEASEDELEILYEFEKELSHTKGFRPKSVTVFKNLMEAFQDNAIYVIAWAHLNKAEQKLLKELLDSKYQKDPEALEAKIRLLHQIQKIRKKEGDVIPAAAALYLKSNDTVWNLYLYHHQSIRFMHGCDAIHVQMIEHFQKMGIKNYDFCGFSGSTETNDPYYGLYQYKSSFGSNPIEYLGEFNYVLNESSRRKN